MWFGSVEQKSKRIAIYQQENEVSKERQLYNVRKPVLEYYIGLIIFKNWPNDDRVRQQKKGKATEKKKC